MIKVEVLSLSHLESIRLRLDHAIYVSALGKWNAKIEQALVKNGGIALVSPDGVVACAGVSLLWEGVGQIWMRTGELAAKYPHALARRSKTFVESVERTLQLRRVQCTVNAGNVLARRFIGWLGFTAEGLMRSYGPEGFDYMMFAKVRG